MGLDPKSHKVEPLLHTKLEIPSLASRVLRRARLTSQIERPGDRKVTIISAPAGYGKTTLLGEWFSLNSAPDNRTAWLTLDVFDNAPFRFWSYLITAVKQTYPAVRFDIKALLAHGYNPEDFSLLTPLINEIGNLPGYLHLILDDYHSITEKVIHEGIAYLIDHQPMNLHIVIASRTRPDIPLARLRTLGRLSEIDAQDLAFSFEETRKYLADSVKETLTPNEVVEIYEKTEGWIAGLQMTAIARETGQFSPPNPTRGHSEIMAFPDYFSEEVLKNQDPLIREFLIKTSVLTEFSVELCDFLFEREDSRSIIEELISQNLFIKPIDSQREWFRYHPLFAASLVERLRRLDPQSVKKIHDSALTWLLEKGYPEKAVVHALQSGHEDQAAEIIDTIAMQAVINFDLIKLIHWINAIPDNLLIIRPSLGIYNAVAYFLLGQYEIVQVNLVKVENAVSNNFVGKNNRDEIRAIIWEVKAIRACMEAIRGDHAKGLADGMKLLKNTSQESNYIYGMLMHALGMGLEVMGELKKAIKVYVSSRKIGLDHNYFYGYFHSSAALANALLKQGKLNEAKKEFDQALDFAIELKLENATVSLAQTSLLEIALEQNDITLADRLAGEILANFDKTIFSESAWISHIDRCVYLTNYFVHKNDLKNAREYFERAVTSHLDFSRTGVAMPAGLVDAFARLIRAEAETHHSSDWSQTAVDFLTPVSLNTPAGRLIQARIHLLHKNYAQAINVLQKLVEEIRHTEFGEKLLQALVLFALALYGNSEIERTNQVIEEALQIGATRGSIRTFVEEKQSIRDLICEFQRSKRATKFDIEYPGYLYLLTKLLDLQCSQQNMPAVKTEPVMTTIHLLQEPLSERETEVASMIITGKTAKEIADALMVSINTAKTHIKNVYRKYGVHSRNMLINRMKELVK